jgi:hypothetical protein
VDFGLKQVGESQLINPRSNKNLLEMIAIYGLSELGIKSQKLPRDSKHATL